jgi:benzodiazapine receptor
MSRTVARPAPSAERADLLVLLGYLVIAGGLSALGIATVLSSAGATYGRGPQPAWQPPIELIEGIWTVLFLAAAVAGWLVHRRRSGAVRPARWLYWVLVVLEAAWLTLFLLGANLWLVLGVILVLDLVAVATTVSFWRVTRLAGLLLAPTVVWLVFGTLLSLAGTALRAP